MTFSVGKKGEIRMASKFVGLTEAGRVRHARDNHGRSVNRDWWERASGRNWRDCPLILAGVH